MAEDNKQEGKERFITVEIGHFPQDINAERYQQIIGAANQFSYHLPGHSDWPSRWRIDMQKWYQAAAAHFACDPDFMCPWHDCAKDLPPYNTVVLVVLPLNGLHGLQYCITDALIPSLDNRDPQAYYDRYGFEELTAVPIAWAYIPNFPLWLKIKIDTIKH